MRFAMEYRYAPDVEESMQLHTNPVNVIIGDRPIRVSRNSALWCAETIKLLWKNRRKHIAKEERAAAQKTYQRSIETYERLAREAPAGT